MKRPSWDEYFMEMAELTAKRSTCMRRSVGAVIVKDRRAIATGYNGAPRGRVNCNDLGKCIREELDIPRGERYELCRSVHAEQNAIIQAGQDRCMGASMYIYGHDFICILCKRFIVQAGIKNCVLKKDEFSPVVRVSVDDIRNIIITVKQLFLIIYLKQQVLVILNKKLMNLSKIKK